MKRQGNDPALAAADYFHGPKAVQGGQIVDPEAKLYSQDFMKKYNAMGGPGAETAGTPTGGVTPTAPTSRPPDMTQAAAPSPTSMGGPSFTPAIPGAPKGLNVVDASKTPTPHLDAYMKANPTVMEQNPQYAMMMERNAMMEKAYYEKIAPKMMDAYTKAMLQNDKLQSDQWKTMVQAYTRLQTSENTLKGRIAAAGISEEGRVQAATIAGEKAQLVQQMRTDTALQLAGLKGVSGWAGLKVLNGMVTQNGNLIGRMQSAIGSAETARENALARVKGDEQKTKDVNDRYDALEQKYNDIINNTYTLNDKLRVAANSTLMSNPGMEQFLTPQDKYAFGNWQQQMPQQGGGGIGGGAVSPFFNQQLSPNIGGAGPSPSSPQPPAGATSTTPAPSSSQGTAVPSGEIGIINGIFGKPAY
jgi:hypothetical protein